MIAEFLERARRTGSRTVDAVALRILLRRGTPAELRRRAAHAVLQGRSAAQLGLADLSAARLLEVAGDAEQRTLLLGAPGLEPRALLDLAGRHEDLSAAVLALLRRAKAGALGDALYQTIVLDRAGGAARLNLALAATAANATRLAPQRARSIFERCLMILGRRLDPYDPNAARASGAARQAAAAILAGDSELDQTVTSALADEAARPHLQMLVTSALKERPDRAAERFGTYLKPLSLNSEKLIRFAEDCDADRGALRAVVRRRPTRARRLLSRARRRFAAWTPLLAALLAPIAAAVALAFAARHAGKTLASAGIDPGVAIGALALLAAVEVFSVQLAAQRLPGPLAAATVATPVALSGYATGLLMLVASILGKQQPQPSWRPSLVASGLLVVFVVLVALSTTLSLRSTGAAAASEAVGRRRIGQARRTGSRAGRLHRAAADMQQVIDAHPCLRRFTSAQEATHRFRIEAASSGYVHVDARHLRQVAQLPRFMDGDLRLDVLVAPGMAVDAGQELASVVPAGGVTLYEADLRAAERPFRLRSERRLDRFAELCAVLCMQLPFLVREGDPGGARRALHVVLDLLGTHLDHDARGRGEFKSQLPLSPALTQVVDKTLAELEHAPGREREVLGRLLCDVLGLARKNDDGLIAAIAGRLGGQARTLTDFDVLYTAGTRAILLDSWQALAIVQYSFHRLTGGTTDEARYANEAEGRLVTFCAAVAPRLSRAAWRQWWNAALLTPEADRVWIALRVGAAALPVANLSLGVEVSLALADQDLDALERGVRNPSRSAVENFLSQSYGRLLGIDAEQRIIDFVEFARGVTSSVADAATRA